MDTALQNAIVASGLEKLRRRRDVPQPSAELETVDGGGRKRKLPPRPAWFGSDENATHANLLVAQALDVGKGSRS